MELSHLPWNSGQIRVLQRSRTSTPTPALTDRALVSAIVTAAGKYKGELDAPETDLIAKWMVPFPFAAPNRRPTGRPAN
jgi:hypothetical protein